MFRVLGRRPLRPRQMWAIIILVRGGRRAKSAEDDYCGGKIRIRVHLPRLEKVLGSAALIPPSPPVLVGPLHFERSFVSKASVGQVLLGHHSFTT